MIESGSCNVGIADGIGTITFFHPKSNSLPGALLRKIADSITELGANSDVKVIVLKSEGEKVFCGGASFDEFRAITNEEEGVHFFMGFALVILAMRACPKFIIARCQGAAVGGAVGVLAASDYVLAHKSSSVKLSELALGIGPFIIGPAVEKRIGSAGFTALTIDTEWRSAEWAKEKGLFVEIYDELDELDVAVDKLTSRLAEFSPDAMKELKSVFWAGTEGYENLLEGRAQISGRLILSDYTKQAIAAFDNR